MRPLAGFRNRLVVTPAGLLIDLEERKGIKYLRPHEQT